MSVVLLKVFQVILALSILIIVHETGHCLFSKLFHIKVEKFYLFFDVGGVRLFSSKHSKWFTRLFPRAKDAETDFGIGWLPLGGYCKICGMVDESMDLEQLKGEPEPYEFRAHPSWQRLLVMAGGVLFNFILAIVIYIGLLSHNGEAYIANEESRIYAGTLAEEMGFKTGDRILSFDDYVPENFGMLQADLVRRSSRVARVLRGQDTVSIYIDHSLFGEVLKCPDMFSLALPFIVDTLMPGSPNAESGLMHGDRITAINGTSVPYVQDSRKLCAQLCSQDVTATVVRGEDSLSLMLQVDSAGLLGIYPKVSGVRIKKYNAIQAIPAGISMAVNNISGYVRDLKLVFTPSTGAYKSVGSFIAVGQAFPSAWDWLSFFSILAMLSVMLGVMNLIPIPGLDGGHIVFIIYEMVSGRKPSDRFLAIMQIIGLVIIMLLMILAFGNDITRLTR